MSDHVALLRGVNVGGAHRLPMAQLAEILACCGARNIETLLQSGNALFEAPDDQAYSIAAAVEATLLSALGFAAPIVLRSATQWREIFTRNPFLSEGADPAHLHVAVWNGIISPGRLASLDSGRSEVDSFRAGENCLFLHLPNGVARSKLTNAWLDASLRATCTFRNWATALRLAKRLEERAAARAH